MNAPETPKKTILYDLHVSLGARMAPSGGYLMPVQYAGSLQEHVAARNAAALFDTSHMGLLRVTGATAAADLERLVTCRVSDLSDGQSRYGLMCNPRGGTVDDLQVYKHSNVEFMLVVNPATQDSDAEWIRRHCSAQTSVERLSPGLSKIDLQGPASPRILQRLVEGSLAGLEHQRFATHRFRSQPILVSRTGYTGEIGFELYGPPSAILTLWRKAMDLGAVPAGLGARDTLRIEMGLPLHGQELIPERNAGESGLIDSAGKQLFIGAEVVLDTSRRTARQIGIEFPERRAARTGDTVLDDNGQPIGVVTSGCFAPSLGRSVAMAYVSAAFMTPGRVIAVRSTQHCLVGEVAALPFYKKATVRHPIHRFLPRPDFERGE